MKNATTHHKTTTQLCLQIHSLVVWCFLFGCGSFGCPPSLFSALSVSVRCRFPRHYPLYEVVRTKSYSNKVCILVWLLGSRKPTHFSTHNFMVSVDPKIMLKQILLECHLGMHHIFRCQPKLLQFVPGTKCRLSSKGTSLSPFCVWFILLVSYLRPGIYALLNHPCRHKLVLFSNKIYFCKIFAILQASLVSVSQREMHHRLPECRSTLSQVTGQDTDLS